MPINSQGQNLKTFPNFLPSETQIVLDNNQIETIPATIETAKNLTTLYLRNNKVSILPLQLFNLPKLRSLLLGHNQITQIPKEIENLSSLIHLRVENNKLSELPPSIGNLKNLTHLRLENNQITFLPEEIRNLTNLVHLSLDGNPLALPPNYAINKPQETIAYILEQQQSEDTKNALITKKAFFFINASKPSINTKYLNNLQSFSKEKSVEFIPIKSTKEIKTDTNVVFLIAPLDVHSNEKLIFDIATKCKKRNVRFYILLQNGFIEKDYDSVNLIKGEVFEKIAQQLAHQFANESNTFSSYEEFNNIVFEALKQHKPNIVFCKLYLENIGHFSNLEIPFDKELTCIIGENGTGKSTILRALAFAAIGLDHKKIDEKAKRDFLKILDVIENKLVYKEGLIKLDYTIDGELYQNELKFIPKDDGRDIDIIQTGDFEIVYGTYNLKSLIVGFPQSRGNDIIKALDYSPNKITQPHINDLLPLINNSEDYRLQSFAGWIANLYGDSIKQKEKIIEKSKEDIIIDEVFKIISQITKKQIRFKTVKTFAPPEVWITTFDAPNGIPLNLISQGFKIIIGWIGYFLQRFINTFPLSEPQSAFKERAILLLDEIDTSIHPVWQTTILGILRMTFPNTQFIFTTHSPLMIAGLNREQVVEMKIDGSEVIALKNQVDTWALSYRDILQKLFDTTDPLPSKTIEELTDLLSKTTNPEMIEALNEDIGRLEQSAMFENEFALYEKQLLLKQAELDELILKYKEKLQ